MPAPGGGRGVVVGVARRRRARRACPTTTISSRSWVTVGRPGEPAVGEAAGEPALELASEPLRAAVLLRHGDYNITSLQSASNHPDRRGDRVGLVLVGVPLPGPEEAPEAVLAVAGDGVHMEVRDALAHHVVHRPRTIPAAPIASWTAGRHRCTWAKSVVASGVVEVAQGLDVRRGARRACGPGTAAGGRGTRRRLGVSSTKCAGTSPAMIAAEQRSPPAIGTVRLLRRRVRALPGAGPPSRFGTITLRRK